MSAEPRPADVQVVRRSDELYAALATRLVTAVQARQPIERCYRLALAGGATARALYVALAERHDVPWGALELFWSDERAVPGDHADSNYRLARETLLTGDPIAPDRIHPMTVGDDLDAAARDYERVLREAAGSEEPTLDAVLLGLGPDGPIASLFPGAGDRDRPDRLVVAVHDSPKPPPRRLTMTSALINRSGAVHLIVVGAAKAEAVRRTLEGRRDADRWPAQRIAPVHGTLTWWLDAAAASKLKSEG